MSKIGIGITTLNRPDLLERALHHFEMFWPEHDEVKLVVVDDFSDASHSKKYAYLMKRHTRVSWVFNSNRKGVAQSKNVCIDALRDCDHIFLFDDDCWPVKKYWEEMFIVAAHSFGLNHCMLMDPKLHGLKTEHQLGDADKNLTAQIMTHCSGVMLFLTKKVVEEVGYFNPAYKTYGYEHMGYSTRISRSGINKNLEAHVHLKDTEKFFHSVDFLAGTCGGSVLSALSFEEKWEHHEENRSVYFKEKTDGPIYVGME